MNRLENVEGPKRVNLTDEDSQLMKGRNGIINGYNAQAMVSPLSLDTAKRSGMLITAVNVINNAADCGQIVPNAGTGRRDNWRTSPNSFGR